MTPSEIQDLLEDIALEKSILDAALDLGPAMSSSGSIDLRGEHAVIGVSSISSLGGQGRAEFVAKIMLPVLFGSTWKILDLMVERAWQSRGGGSRPSIKDKVTRALTDWSVDLMPLLGNDAGIAERVAIMYSKTQELRHALVHRRLTKQPTGELVTTSGDTITSDELNAFCRLGQQLPACLENGFESRRRSILAWWLNQLQRIHGLGPLGDAYAPRPYDTMLVNAWTEAGEWFVNTEIAHAKARSTNGGFPYAELRVHAPDGQFVTVEEKLEQVPRGERIRFDPIGDLHWPAA